MAEHSTFIDSTLPTAGAGRPLLSALSRWWSPANTAPEADPVLGYESAHPWALGEDGEDHGDAPC